MKPTLPPAEETAALRATLESTQARCWRLEAQVRLLQDQLSARQQEMALLARLASNEGGGLRSALQAPQGWIAKTVASARQRIAAKQQRANQARRLKTAITLCRQAQLVDETWYREHYADVREAGLDPVEHFIRYGLDERRQPNPSFDWYLDYASIRPILDVLGRE